MSNPAANEPQDVGDLSWIAEWERLPPTELQELDSICDRFEQAMRSGRSLPIESFLENLPVAKQRLVVCELIEVERCVLELQGQAPVAGDYLLRFPQWSNDIQRIFNSNGDTEIRDRAETKSIAEASNESLQPAPRSIPTTHEATHGSLVGITLGHYEILEEIGRGGMGIVYRARDAKLHRDIAIKALAPHACQYQNSRERFLREARAAGVIKHPNVVTIHAVDEIDGVPMIAMELIDGENLESMMNRGVAFEVQDILRIGIEIARGLAAAHRRGLIHRDVKPANILLDRGDSHATDGQLMRSGGIKLSDFGLARASSDSQLTHPEMMAGTPQYMSPEQIDGEAVDHRSDLFSLGSVLYKMCAGHSPFVADSIAVVLRKVVDLPHRSLQEVAPEIPSQLTKVIDTLLQKSPEDRFQNAEAVVQALSRVHGFPSDDIASLARRAHDSAGTHEELQAQTAPASSRSRWPIVVGLLAFAAIPFVLWGIFFIQAEDGEFKLVTDSPQIATMLDASGGMVVENRENQQRFIIRKGANRLPAGNYDLVVATPSGMTLSTKKFQIKNGDQIVATISMSERSSNLDEETSEFEVPSDLTEHPLLSKRFVWSEPKSLGDTINTLQNESHPSFTGDGLRLLFLRDSVLMEGTRADISSDFDSVQPISGSILDDGNVDSPCISSDGLSICFASARSGTFGRNDIWVSYRPNLDAPFVAPVHLGNHVNTPSEDSTPAFSSDALSLWYCSGRGVRDQTVQLFEAKRSPGENSFQAPTLSTKQTSSTARDFFPRLSVSDRILLFTSVQSNNQSQHLRLSARADTSALFVGSIPLPNTINRGTVGAGTLTANGEVLVYDSNRSDGKGGFDLWMSRRLPSQ